LRGAPDRNGGKALRAAVVAMKKRARITRQKLAYNHKRASRKSTNWSSSDSDNDENA
jgi:hypothetical protein